MTDLKYGRRNVAKMIREWGALRQSIRAEGTPAIQNALDQVEEHIDYSYRAIPGIEPHPDPRDLETCGKCMGSGYGGHPDSGHLCDDCDGIGGVLQPDPRDEVIARLVDAFTIAANRLQRCAVDYDTGRHEFIETSEWAQEARAALAAAKAVQK